MDASFYTSQVGPYVAIVTGVLLLLVLVLVLGKVFGRRKRGVGELGMLTVEGMKKKGLLTKEEYEAVRRKTAQRELERMRSSESKGDTDDLLLMQRAITDPGALSQLLSPEEQALLEQRKRQAQAAEAARQGRAEAPGPSAAQQLMQERLRVPEGGAGAGHAVPGRPGAWKTEPEFVTDPLARTPPAMPTPQQAPPPAMNMTPVVRAKQEAQAAAAAGQSKASELDELLAKGAITAEEHARLKKFFE